jgi:hypothetical protein
MKAWRLERLGGELSFEDVPPQVRHDHATAAGREHGRDIHVAVNVIRESMEKQHDRPIAGADVVITNIENAGLDLLDRLERLHSFGVPRVRVRRFRE